MYARDVLPCEQRPFDLPRCRRASACRVEMFKPLMSLCPGFVSRSRCLTRVESFVFPYPKFVCFVLSFCLLCFSFSSNHNSTLNVRTRVKRVHRVYYLQLSQALVTLNIFHSRQHFKESLTKVICFFYVFAMTFSYLEL